jgi:hypothetical protein
MARRSGGWPMGLISAALVMSFAAAAEAQSVTCATSQSYHQGDPSSPAPMVTVSCGGGIWHAGTNIHLIIPSTLNLEWDPNILNAPSQVTFGGNALAKVNTSGVSYIGTKCCVITLTSNFSFLTPDTVSVTGLQFRNFGAPSSGVIGGASAGSSTTADVITDSHTITIVSNPTISSGSPQTVLPPGPVTANDILLTDGNPPGIWAANGIRITIPNSLNMTWDSTQTVFSVSGAAAGLVSTALGPGNFENGNKTVHINLSSSSNFGPGGSVTLSGLRFAAIGADSGPAALFVTTTNGNTGTANGTDSFSKTIVGTPTISSFSSQVYTVGDPSTATPQITIKASPGSPSKISAANGIKIIIPPTLNMVWDPSIQTGMSGLVFGGTGSSHVDLTPATIVVTYPTPKTALISLLSDFNSGDLLTVLGLRFKTFSAASAKQSLTLDTTAAQATDDKTFGIGAPALVSQIAPPGQVFQVNGGPSTTAPAADILVSDDAQSPALNRITAAGAIRIRIPTSPTVPSLVFDGTVGSVTCAGTAVTGGFITSSAGVTYEDGGHTAVVAVNSDWLGNSLSVTLHGLVFQNFTAALAPINLTLCLNGPGGTTAASDPRIIAIGGSPSIVSAVDQAFTVNDPSTPAWIITVMDANGVATIKAAKGVAIKIPTGFPMQFVPTVQKLSDGLSFGVGAGTGTVGPDGSGNFVNYSNNNQTALINVTADFSINQTLTINGLVFQSFTNSAAPDHLQLSVDPLSPSVVPDTHSIAVGRPVISVFSSQILGAGDPSTGINTVTVTEDPVVPRVQAANGIRIHIPPGLNMVWDPSVHTLADGLGFTGTGAGHVSANPTAVIVSYPNPTTALISLLGDFNPGEILNIGGLKGMNFAVSPPLGLTLEVNNRGTTCSTTVNTITVSNRPQLLTIQTADANGNGSIDRLILTFDKPINGTTSSVTTGLGFSITLPPYTIGAGSAAGSVVTFALVEKGAPDTGVTPTLSYNPAVGNLQDNTGLGTGFTGPRVVLDGAPPIVTGISAVDTDGNGHLDTVTISWSEPLSGAQNVLDWQLIDADGTTNLLQGLVSMVTSGNTVTFHLANTSGTTGVPRFLYTPSTAPTIQDLAVPPNAAVRQTNNLPPIASAGSDLAVPPSKITLDASTSFDPNGQPLTFAWAQTGGSPAWTLDNPNIAKPSFLGTTAGNYTFQVTVSDALSSSIATVHITIINVPPGADAGSNQTAQPLATVYLEALGSSDANGDALTFTWKGIGAASPISLTSLTGLPGVVFFQAPTPSASLPSNNILPFQVTVSDGTNSSTSEVLVRLNGTSTLAPTADAGPDRVVYVGSTVKLDGSLSRDPQGLPLSYLWTSTVPLSSSTSVNPTFVPPVPGIYTFQLVVTSSAALASFPSTVKVLVQTSTNQAPLAVAQRVQPAGEIVVGDLVILDGSASLDPEGVPVTYAWTQTAGAFSILTTPGSVQSSFTPVNPGTYTFQLIVSDGVNLSLPSQVSFTVKKLPGDVTFTATPSYGTNISGGQALLSALPLTLNVTTSDVPNTWFFYWSQTDGPALNFNPLLSGSAGALTFTPQVPGYYTFRVAATTFSGIRAYGSIDVVVDNAAAKDSVPVADAGLPQMATAGQAVTLDASLSTDTTGTFGAGLHPFWTQTGGPPVLLSNPYGRTTIFTPIAAGTYTFKLTVATTSAQSRPSVTTVTVQPAAAPPVPGGGGSCGLGAELGLLLPLLWAGSWLLRRRAAELPIARRN